MKSKSKLSMNTSGFRRLYLLALFIVLITGCSKPAISDAQKIVEEKIKAESDGKIRLVNFKKTNGVPDGNTFRMEYEVTVEFLQDGSWLRGSRLDSQPSFGFSSVSYIFELFSELN